MTTKALPITVEEYEEGLKTDPEGREFRKIETPVPGVDEPIINHVHVILTDDMDSRITDDVQEVTFGMPVWHEPEEDGESSSDGYWGLETMSIDLGKKNRDALVKALDKFKEHARTKRSAAQVTGGRIRHNPSSANPEKQEFNRRARTWGLEQQSKGSVWTRSLPKPLGTQGPLPQMVIDAYTEAHPSDPDPQPRK